MKQLFILLIAFIITMLLGGGLFAQTNCDPQGNGNPDLGGTSGTGEGYSTTSGDLAWELLDNSDCLNATDTEWRLKDYDPTDQCNNSSNLIPESGSKGLKIAIIDSGVRPTAPGRFNEQNLFSYSVSSTGIVTQGGPPPHPHGTFSAGVISGMLKRSGGNSFANIHRYNFYDYQVLDGDLRTSLAAVIAAINHAIDNRVQLISLSIGFVPRECDNIDWNSPESPLNVAIRRAEEKGVIFITSAGNSGKDLAESPQYPGVHTGLKNVISVGALSCKGDEPASFSNYGVNEVDVFTTGDYVQVFYNGCFHAITGTSFATSIVAGKAALHLTKTNDASKVLCLLRSQTQPFPDEQYSIYGIVDVPTTSEASVCTTGQVYDPNGGSNTYSGGGTGQGFNNGGEGSASNWREKSAITSGFSSTPVEFEILVSPNPFSDQLRVDIESVEGKSTVFILDVQGRRLMNREVYQSSVVLNLQDLPSGVYWLNVRNATGSETRTIVKK